MSGFDAGAKMALSMVLDILKEESYKVINDNQDSASVQAVLDYNDHVRERIKAEMSAIK